MWSFCCFFFFKVVLKKKEEQKKNSKTIRMLTLSILLKEHVDILIGLVLSLANTDEKSWQEYQNQLLYINLVQWLQCFKTILNNKIFYQMYKKCCTEMFVEEVELVKFVFTHKTVPPQQFKSIRRCHSIMAKVCSCYGSFSWESNLEVLLDEIINFSVMISSSSKNTALENIENGISKIQLQVGVLQKAMDTYITRSEMPNNTMQILKKIFLN